MTAGTTMLGSTLPEVSFGFDAGGDGASWRVLQLRAKEGLSELYEAVIDLATDDLHVTPDDLLEKAAVLSLSRMGHTRRICGLIRQVDDQGSTDRSRLARVYVVPWLYQLSQRVTSRIFQHMSARDVVKAVLRDAGVYTATLRDETTGQYPEREFCVQYRESDLAFVMRLLEDEGIGFYFAHDGAEESLVLIDDVRAFHPLATMGGGDIPVAGAEAETASIETVRRFDWGKLLAPTGVTLRDYDFTHPSAWVNMTRPQPASPGAREIYEHPARYTINEYNGRVYAKHDGQRLSQIRHQEHRTWERTGRGASNVTGFTPGFTFGLSDHGRGDLNRRYVVTHVEHFGVATDALREVHHDEVREGDRYRNTFSVIDAAGPYRPKRVTPRPLAHGTQTALVVGPPGEEIHVDEHGRIKVQFHWDRDGNSDDRSSCWIRASQSWGGGGWGFVFVPRIGMEAIVTFLEGDPDRPLVTGCVYNAANTPPYPLPESKTKSTLKTNSTPGGGGYNELRFEDQSGSEEVYLQAQKDFNELVKNNHSTTVNANQTNTVHQNQTETVDQNQTITVHQNQTLTVDQNQTHTVHQNQTLTVDQNQTITVHGDRTVTVDGKEEITVHNQRWTTIEGGYDCLVVDGNQDVTINGPAGSSKHVTGTDSIDATEKFTVCVGGSSDFTMVPDTMTGQAPAKVRFDSGSSYIEMVPGKVTITSGTGSTITLDGSTITLDATTINVQASSTLMATAPTTSVTGSATLTLDNAEIKIIGTSVHIEGSGATGDFNGNVKINGSTVEMNC
ncbi:MAG: type VI secretion system tip protein TssI/VgrG [Polyangiales bacterium]